MSQARFQAEVSDEEREQDEAMQDALAEYAAAIAGDAYELSDPKSPGWFERQCDHAEYLRKAAREDALLKSTEETK